MKIQTLCSLIAKAEGLKVPTPIGNIREVMRRLRVICENDLEAFSCLGDYVRYRRSDALKIVRKMTRKVKGKK